MTVDEAKKKLEEDAFLIDVIYTFHQQNQKNKQKVLDFLLVFGTIVLIIYTIVNDIKLAVMFKYMGILSVIYIFISFIITLMKNTSKKEWVNIKVSVTMNYLSKIDNIDSMDKWVANKIFKSDLAPAAGVTIGDNFNSEDLIKSNE